MGHLNRINFDPIESIDQKEKFADFNIYEMTNYQETTTYLQRYQSVYQFHF